MWASWPVIAIFAAIVISIFAFAGWIFAVPLGLLGMGALLALRNANKHSSDDVSELREQARKAAPLDKGRVEFTERDKETLSS